MSQVKMMMMMMVVTAVTVNRQRQGQQVPIQGQVLRLPAPGDLVARNFSKVEHCPQYKPVQWVSVQRKYLVQFAEIYM